MQLLILIKRESVPWVITYVMTCGYENHVAIATDVYLSNFAFQRYINFVFDTPVLGSIPIHYMTPCYQNHVVMATDINKHLLTWKDSF